MDQARGWQAPADLEEDALMFGFEITTTPGGRYFARRTCAGKLGLKTYLLWRWV